VPTQCLLWVGSARSRHWIADARALRRCSGRVVRSTPESSRWQLPAGQHPNDGDVVDAVSRTGEHHRQEPLQGRGSIDPLCARGHWSIDWLSQDLRIN
jgi:hypothetical protein